MAIADLSAGPLQCSVSVLRGVLRRNAQRRWRACTSTLWQVILHWAHEPQIEGPARPAQERMEALAGARFNSCLLNLYRDGRDAMGWHSDNEPLYGAAPAIGAVVVQTVS